MCMQLTDSIILGLVQGITEFLPISSSGHLVLVRELLSIESTEALAFDAVLHLATTISIIIYFRKDLWVLVQAALRKMGRLPVNEKDLKLVYALILGTIPAVALGLATESFYEKDAQSIGLVAIMLFIASVFFMYVEWRYYLRPMHEVITIKRGLQVGFFQALALLPGFSRSGSTIAGGMLLGLSRYEASRFSFLLAIPITLGVGLKKSIDLLQEGSSIEWGTIMVGASVAAITALFVIHFFLQFVRKYTLWPFIWYSLILSAFVGYIAFVG